MPFASFAPIRRCAILFGGCVAAVVITACTNNDQPTSPQASSSASPALRANAEVPSVSPVPAGRTLPIRLVQRDRRLLPFATSVQAPLSAAADQAASPVLTETGSPALVWYATDGTATYWQTNGPSFSGRGATVLQIPAPWNLVAAGDLNGDNNPDLIWEATDGTRAVTYMNGAAYAGSYAMLFVIPPEWKIVGIADFNADTKPDMVLNNSVTGATGVLFLNGTTWTGVFGSVTAMPSTWRVAAIGDLNNDSKPDIVWRDTASAASAAIVTLMNGVTAGSPIATIPAPAPSAPWRVAAVADFDGDGYGDFVMQNLSNGSRIIWHMNVASYRGFSYLPTVSTAFTVVSAPLIQWPILNSYIVNTGPGPNAPNAGYTLSAIGSSLGQCTPQPACEGYYQNLGGRFSVGATTTIDHIEGWMTDGNGSLYVNIRADSAGRPGPLVYSKAYQMGHYGAMTTWAPFSQYNAILSTGTYWVTFEPIAYGYLIAHMPSPAPNPLSAYAAQFIPGVPNWAQTGQIALGIRISGHSP